MAGRSLVQGSGDEAYTRPEDRGEESERGHALDEEIGLDGAVIEVKKKFNKGEVPVEEVNRVAGTRR